MNLNLTLNRVKKESDYTPELAMLSRPAGLSGILGAELDVVPLLSLLVLVLAAKAVSKADDVEFDGPAAALPF
jgi:hypothetical protein